MVVLAVASGWAERRRRNRRDVDRVGLVPWAFIQFAALFASFLFASLALHI
jgi:hypothetical protein